MNIKAFFLAMICLFVLTSYFALFVIFPEIMCVTTLSLLILWLLVWLGYRLYEIFDDLNI